MLLHAFLALVPRNEISLISSGNTEYAKSAVVLVTLCIAITEIKTFGNEVFACELCTTKKKILSLEDKRRHMRVAPAEVG